MTLRDRAMAGLVRQLGHPQGLRGRAVGVMLNRGNKSAIEAAIGELSLKPGARCADLGFGGGVGLRLLLAAADEACHVDGVDISTTMISEAQRRFRAEMTAGRLELHAGSLTALPLPDRGVDGAITLNTFYFIEELDRAAAELARVTAPGGTVVIGLADPNGMAKLPVTKHGFLLRPVAEVIEILAAAGLALKNHRVLEQGLRRYHLLVTATVDQPE